MKLATQLIHAGVQPDPSTGAIMTPIYQTSTYVQEAPGVHKGYEYARTQNPTRHALEEALAVIEKGAKAVCFGSGLAATDAILKTLRPGDEVIATHDLYGGTYRIFTQIFAHYGIRFHFVDMSRVDLLKEKINANTKLVWVETPTNPMLNVIDIQSVAQVCRVHHLLLCVDNTFSSPVLQQPIEWGADYVLHSATKYLGGHSDTVMGAVIAKDEALAAPLYYIQNACGAIPGPQDCFLVLRGLKTLHLRVKAHCQNAMAVAQFLTTHPKVAQVNYPGLSQHPQHAIAKQQMRDFGGMVSFSLKDNRKEAAVKVLTGTKLFALAESLGGVESLIGHPATMTHASIPLTERLKTGVVDSLIRLSVGVEDVEDLINDLHHALDA